MKYFFLLLCSVSFLWGASSGPKVYIPVSEGRNIGDTIEKTPLKSSLYVQEAVAKRKGHIPQGSQQDIDVFNREHSYYTRPFANKTNSYWLDPNFQFGPGSVNDFGGNPNVEQMLGPYIF